MNHKMRDLRLFVHTLFIIAFLFPITAVAQEKESSDALEVTYQCIYQGFSNNRQPIFDFFKLTIDEDKSSFCGTTGPEELYKHTVSQNYSVYKNIPNEGFLVFDKSLLLNDFYYQEPMPNFDWEFIDGDTVVCDYACQKAKVNYRHRTWYVWYTLDLPYSDGPWKLCGLPGLILLAVDSQNDFIFKAIGIQKTNAQNVAYKRKGTKVSPQEMASIIKLCYGDFQAYVDKYKKTGPQIVLMGGYKYPSNDIYLLEYFDEKEKK